MPLNGDSKPPNNDGAAAQNGSEDGPVHNGTLNSNEPMESDPCIGDGDVKPIGDQTFVDRYVNEVSDRTGLSRKGVFIASAVVILAVVLLIIVIALGAAWPKMPHKYQYPVCADGGCLRAAAQISENVNKSVSPCNDLWTYVCGGWLKTHHLPIDKSILNPKQDLINREAQKVRDLVATLPVPLHTLTVEWKLKHFYEACLDIHNINLDKATPLTNIISELGGWYVLRDFNDMDFDKNVILKKLHVRYGVTPFFRISVEPNPHSPEVSSIRISPSGLGLPDKEYYYRDENDRVQVAYKEYIRDIVIYMSSARNEASKFGTDLFSYEKRIAEVTPDSVSLQNPILTYNAITISELKESNLIPFEEILQEMYPESNISEDTEVIVTSLDYLSQISQIIASTDRKTMNGYLIWMLVKKYIPFLPQTYTSALDTFNSELLGLQTPPQRWEMCSQLIRTYMGLATESFLEKINPISEITRQVVNSTFSAILNVAKSRINKMEDTSLLYNHLKLKLNELQLQIGLPPSTKQESFIKDYFLKLKVMKANLFETVKNGVQFKKSLEERVLTTSFPDTSVLKYLLAEEPKVEYSPSDNLIVVPRALLEAPYFENSFPSPVIFGRLGVEIADAVVSSVLPYESLWTSQKKILSPFHITVNESFRSVHLATQCLKNYILNLNLDVPLNVANETALKTLKRISAISIANEALLNSLDKDNHVHQPALEDFEDSPLFFLSYAQTQCSNSTNQYNLYRNILDFELPERSLLLMTWAHLPEFSEAFSCNFNKKAQCRDIF